MWLTIRKNALGFWLLTLVACSNPPTIQSRPTVQVLRVAYPASLTPLLSQFRTCSQNFPETAVFLEEVPSSRLDFDDYEMVLWTGDPPVQGLFSYDLGQQRILVVVHPDNPIKALHQTDVLGLLSGTLESWEGVGWDSEQVSVWIYPPENEIQRSFSRLFMQGGDFSPFARLVPDPAAMIEAVSGDPGAIGLLPSLWEDGDLKTVSLENPISVPILALTAQEPQGVAREILACVQTAQEVQNQVGTGEP